MNQGAFRENLYFRIAGATVRVPPLRERPGNLVPLLERFLGDHASLATPSLLADLERLPWMGNVRELMLYAEQLRSGDLLRAVATARLDAVDSDDFRHWRSAEGELGTMESTDSPDAPRLRAGDRRHRIACSLSRSSRGS